MRKTLFYLMFLPILLSASDDVLSVSSNIQNLRMLKIINAALLLMRKLSIKENVNLNLIQTWFFMQNW